MRLYIGSMLSFHNISCSDLGICPWHRKKLKQPLIIVTYLSIILPISYMETHVLTGIWSTFVVKSEHQNETCWDKTGLCAKSIITIIGSISTQLRGHMKSLKHKLCSSIWPLFLFSFYIFYYPHDSILVFGCSLGWDNFLVQSRWGHAQRGGGEEPIPS